MINDGEYDHPVMVNMIITIPSNHDMIITMPSYDDQYDQHRYHGLAHESNLDGGEKLRSPRASKIRWF